MTAHKKDSCWATCVLPPRCGLCCRWVSTTPWAFPCCSQLMLPEVNRKLLQSWSFYSLYSALCEIKINIESNFFIRTSPRVEFLLTPQRHSSSHCPVRGVGSSSAMGILVCGEHPWVSRETFQLVLHVPPAPGLHSRSSPCSGSPPAQGPVQKHCPEPHGWAQPENTYPALTRHESRRSWSQLLGKILCKPNSMHCNSASGSAADKLFITGPTLGHRAVIVLSCPVFPVETMHTGGKIKANTSKIGELETDHHTTAQVKKSSWLNALFVVSEQLNVTTLHCTNKVWCCQHKGDF